MFATTAYLTRGLQLLLGSSKRAIIERAEEMGAENDDIPLTQLTRSPPTSELSSSGLGGTDHSSGQPRQSITLPSRTQDPSQVRITNGPPQSEAFTPAQSRPRQDPLPPTRPQKWATIINLHLDSLTYSFLFLLLGLPIYYATTYAMPAHLYVFSESIFPLLVRVLNRETCLESVCSVDRF